MGNKKKNKQCSKCPFVYVVVLRKGTSCIQQPCLFQDICHYMNNTSGLFLPVLYLATLQSSSAKVLALPQRTHQIRVLFPFFVRLPNTAHLSFGHSWKMCCRLGRRTRTRDLWTRISDGKCRRETSFFYSIWDCCFKTESRLNWEHYFARGVWCKPLLEQTCKQGVSYVCGSPKTRGIKLKVALLMCRANSQTARGQKKSPLSTVQDATG